MTSLRVRTVFEVVPSTKFEGGAQVTAAAPEGPRPAVRTASRRPECNAVADVAVCVVVGA